MGRRVDAVVQNAVAAHWSGAGTTYLVETPAGVIYYIIADPSSDPVFRKSTDGGRSWSLYTSLRTGTVTALSVWYDKWSGLAGGLIHVAYTDSVLGDTLYRTIDTENGDSLSTETTIFAGASTAAGGHLSVSRARGGNVYCKTCIDAGTEGGFFRLPNANVPNGAWDAARTVDEALATGDKMIVLPGFAADNQDMLCIFYDSSAGQLSRKIYDDSANSWAETDIVASGITSLSAATAFPNMDAVVDLDNSRIIVACWTAADLANADLRCWTVTESAITETSTNVVLNSTDDQALCAISLNTVTGLWTVFYCGSSDGAETWPSLVRVYCKCSSDGGATWGPETQVTPTAQDTRWLATSPRSVLPPLVAYYYSSLNLVKINIDAAVPRAQSLIGV